MSEITFLVEVDSEGTYLARCLSESIFTQADTLEELREYVRDAVNCHFSEDSNRPKLIHLHTS